ncbi:hypothetical protein BDB00DRAFT_873239 [Zychaea mexicana]|uniref:uncharacterized protein n=1 Tax=Zychaea mexicana TaxID=64656 RepID=UPI0022FF1242|nr:uncharacterized protein BDB00DRAFT_873239 [Zychaea mexicana]KAI9492661.1 hypothetical protein BDB00DRAFT_873239 [Zychaea mexicana]
MTGPQQQPHYHHHHHTQQEQDIYEWIRTQLSLYFALSILAPPSTAKTATTTAEKGTDGTPLTIPSQQQWLLCLAHRYFASSIPDLIIRLRHDNDNDKNTTFAQQLFFDHWQIPYTDDYVLFISAIRHRLQYKHPDQHAPKSIFAVIRSMPSFVCMQLDFIHMKLFTSTLVLHDTTDLEHRMQLIQHHHLHHDESNDADNDQRYHSLRCWLDRVQSCSLHGQSIMHAIEIETKVDTDDIDALLELQNNNNEFYHHHGLLSDGLRLKLTQPLQALDQYRYTQQSQRRVRWLEELKQAWLAAHKYAITSMRQYEDEDAVDNVENETVVDIAVRDATRTFQRWSGAAPAANASLYTAMQKQYCEFRQRKHQLADQREHVNAFIQYTEALEKKGERLLSQNSSGDELLLSVSVVESFKDRVHVATERIAARIPYPVHQTLKNADIRDLVRRRKASLWLLQDNLELTLRRQQKNRQQQQQQQQQKTKDEEEDVWVHMRIEALQSLTTSAAMPGLTLHDIQQLQKDCRDYRTTSKKKRTNAKLDALLTQLKNDLDAYEQQVQTRDAFEKLSTAIQEKTLCIWSTLMPIEEGIFDAEDTPCVLADTSIAADVLEQHHDPRIQRQYQDFVALVEYGNALLTQRNAHQLYQSRVKELQTQGMRYRKELELAWNEIVTSFDRHQELPLSAYDDFVNVTSKLLTSVEQYEFVRPSENVYANRPAPYAQQSIFLAWLSGECNALVEINSTVSMLVQKYRLALELKRDMDACLANIAGDVVAASFDDDDHQYKSAKNRVQNIRAQILDTRCCDHHSMVDSWDKLASDALAQLAVRIQQHKQTQQQCMLDAAADGAYARWQDTLAHFDAAATGWQSQSSLGSLMAHLDALHQSTKEAFEEMQQASVSAGSRKSHLNTKKDLERQKHVADIVNAVHAEQQYRIVMAGYVERQTAWQTHMDGALRLCDEQEAELVTLIHDSRMLVTQHENKENNNHNSNALPPPSSPSSPLPSPQLPNIRALQLYVDQHRLHHHVEFDQTLAAQMSLDERIQELRDTTLFARNVEIQCNKIRQLMDELLGLHGNDNDINMDLIAMAKRIQDPELYYPVRGQDDVDFDKMVRHKLESLLENAVQRQRAHTDMCKEREKQDQCNAIVCQLHAKADALVYSQEAVDALTTSAQNGIVRINQLRGNDTSNNEYEQAIESVLATVRQTWEQKTAEAEQVKKQQQDQKAMDAYRQLYDWLAEQHNAIQILNVDDGSVLQCSQQHREKLQSLQRKGIDQLFMRWHNEKRRLNTYSDTMQALYERAKADNDDLISALDYVEDLFGKKQLENSTQAFVDGLLSAMRVTTAWGQQKRECQILQDTQRQDVDAFQNKAIKAMDLFNAYIQAYPDHRNLHQQYQQTESVLKEAVRAANLAKPYCDIHMELQGIEDSLYTLSVTVLDTMLNHVADRIMAYPDDCNRQHALARHGELRETVAAAKAKAEEERQRAEEMEAQKEAERRRLSIEQAVKAAHDDTLAVGAIVDDKDASVIQEFYLRSISALSVHQARRDKWQDPKLNETVQIVEAAYDCLQQVAQHAMQAHEISSWIKTWEGQDVSAMASTVEAFLQKDDGWVDNAPSLIKANVERATRHRRSSVEEAWYGLCEQMKQAETMASERLKEQHEQEQLATVERLIKRARAQLGYCRWDVDKRDLGSMPREPEALAIERRITDLAATTATLMREHYPAITTDENAAYRAMVNADVNQFFDSVQDTQCKIAQALAISEYLMISDDTHMMISIFEESLPSTPRNMSKQDLQAIEAQQKYYDEHIGHKLDTAQAIAEDNFMLTKPYRQLCDRWASVQRRVQSLLRRRATRGRLTSLPTLLASTTSTTTTNFTPNTASSPSCSSSSSNNSNAPSPLASASSPLSPRPNMNNSMTSNNNNNNNNRRKRLYEPDPENQLDVEIGRIVNQAPYPVKVEMVPGKVGRYWFGTRLVYCRILKSRMVMVRVGGGWTELSQFMRDHAMLHDTTASEMHVVSDEQGFIQMSTARRPSLPPPLYNSLSSSTISSSSSKSSGYYMDGDRYMAVDHHGNYHALKMTKVDHPLLSSSGSRSILIK